MEKSIGVYYKTPEGKVAHIYGGGSGMYHYHFNDGKGGRSVNEVGTEGWERLFIKEFPDAKDHVLPYVFDLLWDVKHVSDLVYMVLHQESRQGNSFDEEEARQLLQDLDDPTFWEGYNLEPKDFKRLRRCLRISWGL